MYVRFLTRGIDFSAVEGEASPTVMEARPTVPKDRDIYATANLLIKHFGDLAAIEAAMRAEE